MSAINLVIDGKEIAVEPGTTILQAARKLGIDIPTFCYDPELAPNGACRICVVEVENARALVASCVAPVSAGMVVQTESERVVSARKEILSLLVGNHPLVCITCEKTGACKLQDYCYRYGVADSAYIGEVKNLSPDESNLFFIRDMNKCILCGICVGKCQDIVGAGAIDFTKRGFVANIGPAFEDSIEQSTCVFCGLCIDSCPVGALVPRYSIGQGRSWQVEELPAVCPYCGVGCNITLKVKDNAVIGVDPVKESPVNRGHLCSRGKFGWDYLKSGDRLTSPLIKSDGVFVKVSWEEALGYIADNLEEIKSRYGAGALMGLCSPKVSNEEAYLLKKLVGDFGSENVDSFSRHCHAPALTGLSEALGSPAMTNSIEELADAEVILVIGANPAESHPVLSYRVREAVARGGAGLVVASSEPAGLADIASYYLPLKAGSTLALVNALAGIIIEEGLADENFIEKRTEGFELLREALTAEAVQKAVEVSGVSEDQLRAAARIYAGASKAAIIASAGAHETGGGPGLVLALANLALLTGNIGREAAGLYLPYGENNMQGIIDMGIFSGVEAAGLLKKGNDGSEAIRAIYSLGENPVACVEEQAEMAEYLAGLEFLVVQDTFMTETASLADVVLPSAAFAEQTGTYTNIERRVQLSRAAVEPPAGALGGWAILAEVAGWLGFDWEYSGPEDVFDEIASRTPSYAGITYGRLMKEGLQWPCTAVDHPGTKYLHQGRFSRGLGRFSVVSEDLSGSAGDPKNAASCFLREGACQCQSENLSRHSLIGSLIK